MKTIIPGTVVLAAVLVSSYAVAADTGVAARVNGAPIKAADVQALASRMAAAQQGDDGAAVDPDAAKQQALQSLIDIEVLTQQAKAEKLDVSTDEVDQRLAEMKKQYPSEDVYKKVLEANHATEADLRKDLKNTLLMQKVLDKHVDVKLPPDAAEQFYKANSDKFEHPDEVRASHILFLAPDTGDVEAVKSKAAAALARVKKGEDFAALAKELSEDPGSKDKGGDLGFFPHDGVIKEFADAAFALKPGEVSDLVKTQYGFHIIKVTAKRDAGATPFDEVKADVEKYLQAEVRDKQEHAFVDGLKKNAKIEIVEAKADKKPEKKK